MAFRVLLAMFALLLPVNVICAQQSAEPFSFTDGEPAGLTLMSLSERLGEIEAENARLRELVESREFAPIESVAPRIHEAGYEQKSCGCDKSGCGGGCGVCPNCGKSGTFGGKHLCGMTGPWGKEGGWRVVPFGRLRGEMIYSTAAYSNDAVIAFLNPANPGVEEDALSVTAKQSQINFAISGPEYNGWQTGGVIIINFMGAQPLRNFSGANIVNAYGEFKNSEWRYAFGRMLDLFGPIHPNTVNQLQQRGAGNVGIYRGAFNVDRFLEVHEALRWTISARISQPDIADYGNIPEINGQNNGWPNIETRIGVQLGHACDGVYPVEIGVSGLIGETQAVAPAIFAGLITPGIDEVEQTRGVCLDLQVRGEIIGFRGEAWWGRSAGSYFVATLQSINPETAHAIESIGGWGELYVNVSPYLKSHFGYGVDDPHNRGLGFLDPMDGVGQIGFNDVHWANLIYNMTDNFELGLEISQRRTNFLDADANNEATFVHFSSTLTF